ncbi:hypothetical protein FACS1894202_08420 [Clostridia bacterium]|nr:hypothetical protein FACS1894202_08420 [Clostridia bacterium]
MSSYLYSVYVSLCSQNVYNWRSEIPLTLQNKSFPSSKFKDMVDATSDAFSELENVFDITSLIT